jgi:hypothetical protein
MNLAEVECGIEDFCINLNFSSKQALNLSTTNHQILQYEALKTIK